MTTLTEVANHPLIQEKYRAPRRGGRSGRVAADPQPGHHRRQRLAGRALLVLPGRLDVLPRGRQHLLRRYADGVNREHAILDAERCVAVNPSDTAPALIALDAQIVLANGEGRTRDQRRRLLRRPGDRYHATDDPAAGRPALRIRIPATWAGAQFYFEKIRDRQVWDFPLLNVASAMTLSGDRIERIRIAVNAVAAHPMRLHAVERAVTGKPRTPRPGRWRETSRCRATSRWQFNGYKIPLMRNLVKRAIRADGDIMDGPSEWASIPWGEDIPIHVAWFLIHVALAFGRRVSDRPTPLRQRSGRKPAGGHTAPVDPAAGGASAGQGAASLARARAPSTG